MRQLEAKRKGNSMHIISDLHKAASRDVATSASRYFKTGKGEYGEDDMFLGIHVPQQRAIAKRYIALRLTDIERLLHSPIHEYRQTALYIMTYQWKKAEALHKKELYDLYIRNTAYINNWDLVDSSAPTIIGEYLEDKKHDRKLLYAFAKSSVLWEKRIAVLSTFAFIRNHDFSDSFAIAEILLHDSHDLIHKAVGWMLREVGKRDLAAEETFLKKHYRTMPRTMLRYAIERLPLKKRMHYMQKSA